MVKIANQTLETYLQNMDENSKKVFMNVIKSDTNKLEEEFNSLKENTLEKLNIIMNEESENDLKSKISETIEKIKTDEFNQMNYIKLVSLGKNL